MYGVCGLFVICQEFPCHVQWGSQSKCHPVNTAHWSIPQFTVFVDCLWHDLDSPCHRGFSGRVSHGQSVTQPQRDHQSVTFIFVHMFTIWKNSMIALWQWRIWKCFRRFLGGDKSLQWRFFVFFTNLATKERLKKTLRKCKLVINLFKILIKFKFSRGSLWLKSLTEVSHSYCQSKVVPKGAIKLSTFMFLNLASKGRAGLKLGATLVS